MSSEESPKAVEPLENDDVICNIDEETTYWLAVISPSIKTSPITCKVAFGLVCSFGIPIPSLLFINTSPCSNLAAHTSADDVPLSFEYGYEPLSHACALIPTTLLCIYWLLPGAIGWVKVLLEALNQPPITLLTPSCRFGSTL